MCAPKVSFVKLADIHQAYLKSDPKGNSFGVYFSAWLVSKNYDGDPFLDTCGCDEKAWDHIVKTYIGVNYA